NLVDDVAAELASLFLELDDALLEAEVVAADRIDPSDVVVDDAGDLSVEHLDVAPFGARRIMRIDRGRAARGDGEQPHDLRKSERVFPPSEPLRNTRRGGTSQRRHGRA